MQVKYGEKCSFLKFSLVFSYYQELVDKMSRFIDYREQTLKGHQGTAVSIMGLCNHNCDYTANREGEVPAPGGP